MTVTTERADPLRRRNPGWGGRSTARRPVAAMSKLFLRPPVLVKRFTCEMTLRKCGSQARTANRALQPTGLQSRAKLGRATRIRELTAYAVTGSPERPPI